jgi:predicted double-glycine peptidase
MNPLILPAALLVSFASAAAPTVTFAGLKVVHDDGGMDSGEISCRFKQDQAELIPAVESWTNRGEKTLDLAIKADPAAP